MDTQHGHELFTKYSIHYLLYLLKIERNPMEHFIMFIIFRDFPISWIQMGRFKLFRHRWCFGLPGQQREPSQSRNWWPSREGSWFFIVWALPAVDCKCNGTKAKVCCTLCRKVCPSSFFKVLSQVWLQSLLVENPSIFSRIDQDSRKAYSIIYLQTWSTNRQTTARWPFGLELALDVLTAV